MTLTIEVRGMEPQPMAKKLLGKHHQVYERDPRGIIAAWKTAILLAAMYAMEDQGWLLVPKPYAVAIGECYYRTKPKSNKCEEPTTRPDMDNYEYLTHNLLQGVCYEDDSQLTRRLDGSGKFWASSPDDAGCVITLEAKEVE